jgi:hypothetical protein
LIDNEWRLATPLFRDKTAGTLGSFAADRLEFLAADLVVGNEEMLNLIAPSSG